MSAPIKLASMTLEGFRSFKDRQTITFPDAATVLITGADPTTGVSSGAGKSSIPMAIAYALGFCDLPQTELKNWESKKIYVELILKQDATVYKIIRDPKLSLFVNDVPVEALNAALEAKLAEIIQTSPTLAKTLTYRPQGERGVFVASTDAAKKEFLTMCLTGLAEIEKAEEHFSTMQAGIKSQLTQVQYEIESATSMSNNMAAPVEQLQAASEQVESLKLQLAEAQLAAGRASLLRAQMEALHRKISEADLIQRKVYEVTSENTQLRSGVERVFAEVQQLKECLCPTCQRQWDTPEAKALSQQKQSQIDSALEKMKTNLAYVKNAETVIQAVPAYKNEYASKQQELANASAPYNNAQTALKSAEQTYRTLMDQENRRLAMVEQIKEKTQKIASLEYQDRILGHIGAILGRNGFMGSIFDEILSEIETRTNKMLSVIPNISRFTVSISSTTETKKGTVKKSISTTLLKDGKEVSVKCLSGGQRCSLELCADLAVAKTIQRRSGSPLGWVVLDEAMDGLDSVSKAPAIEMIKQEMPGLVMIIDHDPEIKATFEQYIEVEYDGRCSRVL